MQIKQKADVGKIVIIFCAHLLLCICSVRAQSVDFNGIMNQRIPAFSLVGINSDCINQINQKLQDFKQQDLNQQRLLTNQYNSHREGWVEKVPGTCNAGGPPPICPVDHWIRDPQAMSKWDADQRKVKAAREGELYGISNNCQIAYQKQQQELAEKNKEKQEAEKLKQEQASKDAAAKRQADANARMDEWRRKQQEANQRVANTIDSLRQAQAMQQAKIAAAGDQLQNDMAANNQNAQDAVNNYKQSSELNTDNTDSKNQAKSILNGGVPDNTSSIFDQTNTQDNTSFGDFSNDQKSKLQNMLDTYNQWKDNAQQGLNRFMGKDADEYAVGDNGGELNAAPQEGWTFENTRLNRQVLQPVKDAFNKLKSSVNDNPDYQSARDVYDIFHQALPKTDKETMTDQKKNTKDLMNSVSDNINNFMERDNTDGLNQETEQFADETKANAAGNLLGKFSSFKSGIRKKYDNSIGQVVNMFLNFSKKDQKSDANDN